MLSFESPTEFRARRLERHLRAEAVVTSYSGVILNSHQETPDYDVSEPGRGGDDLSTSLDEPKLPADHHPELSDIRQAFPRGAKAGAVCTGS